MATQTTRTEFLSKLFKDAHEIARDVRGSFSTYHHAFRFGLILSWAGFTKETVDMESESAKNAFGRIYPQQQEEVVVDELEIEAAEELELEEAVAFETEKQDKVRARRFGIPATATQGRLFGDWS